MARYPISHNAGASSGVHGDERERLQEEEGKKRVSERLQDSGAGEGPQ